MISSGQPEVARFCYLRKNLSKRSNLARHLATSIHIKFFDTIKCRGLPINWQEVYIGRYLTYRCCRTNKTLVWWCRDVATHLWHGRIWSAPVHKGNKLIKYVNDTNNYNQSSHWYLNEDNSWKTRWRTWHNGLKITDCANVLQCQQILSDAGWPVGDWGDYAQCWKTTKCSVFFDRYLTKFQSLH